MKDNRIENSGSELNIALILAGGSGSRMQSAIPKQYMPVNQKPLLYYSIKAFQDSFMDEIALVCRDSDIAYVQRELVRKYNFNKVKIYARGGRERYESVYNGLMAIHERHCDAELSNANVFIHDGARPCVDSRILENALKNVTLYHACTAAVPVKDTIKIVSDDGAALSTPDRRTLWQVQTPQTFKFKLIWDAYRSLMSSGGDIEATDDAMTVELFTDTKVYMSEGSYRNIKVTTLEDIAIAEIFLRDS